MKTFPAGTARFASVDVLERVYGTQSDSEKNANKFYALELHKEKGGSRCLVFVDHGRVGVTTKKLEYLNDDGTPLTEYEARAFFAKQAKEKFGAVVCSGCANKADAPGTEKCSKCQRVLNYKDYPKQNYIPVQLAQTKIGSTEAKAVIDTSKLRDASKVQVDTTATPAAAPKSYHQYINDLVDHIYEEAGHATRVSLNTGALKSTAENPLGTLGGAQLDAGKEILTEIASVLNASSGRYLNSRDTALVRLTDRWYTTIPQNIGMRPDWAALCVNNWEKYQKALDLLDLLGDVKGVQSSFGASSSTHDRLTAMGVSIDVLDTAAPKYKAITDYIRRTQSSHHRININVRRIYKIGIKGQDGNWFDPDRVGNVQELFHGSRNANIVGILSKGLLLRPPGVVVTGSMFGNGLYFASQSTKSTAYSMGGWGGTQNRRNNAYLFLSDVALGKVKQYQDAQTYLTQAPSGYHSVMGVTGRSLLHDEYIIYTLRQHRLTYLVDFTTSSR